jgi:hypothetical protein
MNDVGVTPMLPTLMLSNVYVAVVYCTELSGAEKETDVVPLNPA